MGPEDGRKSNGPAAAAALPPEIPRLARRESRRRRPAAASLGGILSARGLALGALAAVLLGAFVALHGGSPAGQAGRVGLAGARADVESLPGRRQGTPEGAFDPVRHRSTAVKGVLTPEESAKLSEGGPRMDLGLEQLRRDDGPVILLPPGGRTAPLLTRSAAPDLTAD